MGGIECLKVQQACCQLIDSLKAIKDDSGAEKIVVCALADVKKAIEGTDNDTDKLMASKIVRPILFMMVGKRFSNMSEKILVETLGCISLCLDNGGLDDYKSCCDLITNVLLLVSQPEDASTRIGTENMKIAALKNVHQSLKAASREVWSEILEETENAFLGHLVFVLLNFLEEKSAELKILALDSLQRFPENVSAESSVKTLNKVLPGVAIKIAQCCLLSPVLHHAVIVNCLLVWSKFVCACARIKLEPNTTTGVEQKLGTIWDKVVESLKRHAHTEVRETLLECTVLMANNEMEFNPTGMLDHAFDLITLYVNDPMVKLSEKAETILEEPNRKYCDQLYAWAENKLYMQCVRLPTVARQGSSEDMDTVFVSMQGLLQVLGCDGLKRICLCSNQLDSMLTGVTQAVLVDLKRVPIASTSNDDWPNLELLFDGRQFVKTIRQFAELCDYQTVVYHLSDKIGTNNTLDRLQNLFVLEVILSANIGYSTDDSCLFDRIINIVVDILCKLDLNEVQPDSVVIDLDRPPSRNSVIAYLCLKTIYRISSLKRNFRDNLLSVLYPTLVCASCAQVFVSQTAIVCLGKLALSCGYDTVDQALLDNCDYLVFSITNKLRHFSDSPECSLVACFTLEHMKWDDTQALPHIRALINETTLAIDSFHQERCLGSLKILLSFLKMVPTWNVELEGGQKDDQVPDLDDENVPKKKEAPPCVVLAHEVLLRTKHLIAANFMPLRLIVLDICRLALICCKYWDDLLLPMIHQNWPALMCRFEDSQMDVRIKVVQVVRTMAEVSNTFVVRRVEEDFVPKIVTFLRAACKESHNRKSVFKQTGTFKLQMALLLNIARIFNDCIINNDKSVIRLLHDTCKMYIDDDKQMAELRNAAINLCDDVRLE